MQMIAAAERYVPSTEQLSLAAAFGEALAAVLPLARLHKASEEDPETWSALEELGLFGLALAEERGGSGLGAVEETLIAYELGRRLVGSSVFATLGAVHVASANAPARVAAAYRNGDRVILVEDAHAQSVLVRSDREVELVARPETPKPVDDLLWAASLMEMPPASRPEARAGRETVLRLRLIDAAALAGLAQTALEMAVGYARVREQFGRPIGSFQAVKHHCANMAIAARSALDQACFAAVALDDGRADAPLQIESALLIAGSAAIENAGKNIQIHGGIGFSAEADPHLVLKRALVLAAIAGGLEAATERVGAVRTTSW